jgi:hypothetical protein
MPWGFLAPIFSHRPVMLAEVSDTDVQALLRLMYEAAKAHLERIEKSPHKDCFPFFKERASTDATPKGPAAAGYRHVALRTG